MVSSVNNLFCITGSFFFFFNFLVNVGNVTIIPE